MILFVGDKPSPEMKPGAKPFEGARCEKRLMEWIQYVSEISKLEMVLGADNSYLIVNQCDEGVKWQITTGASSLYCVFRFLDAGGWEILHVDCIIGLGEEASKLLFEKGITYFKLPHPSGRNRQINNKELLQKTLDECRDYVRLQRGYSGK